VADSSPLSAEQIDKPACFYLGREYDLDTRQVKPDQPVMYEARYLTTHGVVVGMTGSGKTGLSITLLEEAAIDGIPAVIIDPKGDLTNLLLQFPDLKPGDFAAWLHPEDARQKSLSVEQYAAQLAERWKQGLRESGQEPSRIRELSAAVDFRVYTPGSEAGLSLSILRNFAAPKGLPLEDLTHKVNATVTALLGLGGIEGDPVQSREHVLLAQIILDAWRKGRDLDLPMLIQEIPRPAITTVGAYNLETFFPAKDRVKFASQLNNVVASPMFAIWSRGEPLDLGAMLYRNGRPQHLIFSVAHLDDQQRMFFITLLLEEMLAWTRRQSGTTNLRALLYFDEVYGYLPPHPGNPPSKTPLMTLLKQARAFGVGVLLATQNPVDLDYKALSNAGTWFVGKLQTERDKARLLDGLESVAAEYGTLTDRGYLEKVISSLGSRVFLLHNINTNKPVLFQTRWALSFLRGPMTREEIGRAVAPIRERDRVGAAVARVACNHCGAELPAGAGRKCPTCGKNPWERPEGGGAPVAQVAQFAQATTQSQQTAPASEANSNRYQAPVLPADVTQFYIPVAGTQPGRKLQYQAWVLGFAEVVYAYDRRTGAEHRELMRRLAQAPATGHPVNWDTAYPLPVEPGARPEPGAMWADVPETMDTGRKLKTLEKAFTEWLASTHKLSLWENRELELLSRPGESEAAFRARCVQEANAQCAQAIQLEEVKFGPRIEAAKSSTGKGRDDKIAKLEGDLQAKRDEITEKYRRYRDLVVAVQLKPRKTDIRITHFGLAWTPFWV
jgi:hypothetical protein